MRNHKKLPTACSLLLGFALMAHAQPQRAVADKIIAIIGDRTILQSEIDNTLEDMKRSEQPVPPGGKCAIAREFIISKLLAAQAEKDSLPVTSEEVEAELDGRLRSWIEMAGTATDLGGMGKSISQLKDEFRPFIREQRLTNAMRQKILENVRITPSEVKAFYERIPKDNLPLIDLQLELCQIVAYPKPPKDVEQYLVAEMNNYKKQLESKMISFPDLAAKVSEDGWSKEFEMNRNDKKWDEAFLTAAFRLKEGELSMPVKTKFGYYLIQLMSRNGDVVTVRQIFRTVPVSHDDIKASIEMLFGLREEMMSKNIDFKDAAASYNEDGGNQSAGYCLAGEDGSTTIPVTQLDKETAEIVNRLKPNELSKPVVFEANGRKAVRLLYLKSRREPHIMNLKDDYSRISKLAMEEKSQKTIEKWIAHIIGNYEIMVDDAVVNECDSLRQFKQ